MFRSGVALMIYASGAFSLMAVLVKVVSPRVPVLEIVFWRCVLAAPFLAIVVRRRGLPLLAHNRRLAAARTLLGFAAMSLFFFALGQLPIADALLLGKTQPLWVAVLAPWLLRERLSLAGGIALGVALVGAVLVLQPTLGLSGVGSAAIIGSALASSLAHMAIRRLSADDHPDVIVLNFMAGAGLLTLPFVLPSMTLPSFSDGLALVGIAALATVGQTVMTRAYAVEQAPVVAAAGYSTVAFGIAWGLLVWHEIPDLLILAGGALLVGSGVVLMLLRREQRGAYSVPLTRVVIETSD